MTPRPSPWRQTLFRVVAAGCVLFILLTFLAMLFYAGGTITDRTTTGYHFFTNFFSDLGRTVSPSGKPNTVSLILFTTALALAGAVLAIFFGAFTQFFTGDRVARPLSWAGTLFGVAAGICFVGVAFTPANVNISLHSSLVRWAFYLFPIAAIFYSAAILRQRHFPRWTALVFGIFAALLIAYIGLLTLGPKASTPGGLIIQATGQKVIVYASLISIMIEALAAQHFSGKPLRGSKGAPP